LFRDLPDNIQEAYRREEEEASTWPSPSAKPPEESVAIDLGEMDEMLRASLTPFGGTSAPPRAENNSG
jgi:hypothetical protein